jgi:uncharacterized protein YndB with AHSA1/START domain
MHFVRSVTLAPPPDLVWPTFVDPGLLRRWQPTLSQVEVLSGAAGRVGTVTRLTYHEAGRLVVLTETVVASEEPHLFATRYESGQIAGGLHSTFAHREDGGTRWTMTCDVRFQGVLRLLGPMLGAATVHRTEGDMARFKELIESRPVENGGS